MKREHDQIFENSTHPKTPISLDIQVYQNWNFFQK